MNIIKPLFIGAYIAMIAYMPFACTQAWDKEAQIQEEFGRSYYDETLRLQRENPNP